jgi:NAD(P)-dependent dehydrogenase (short-subunit alcohol dehydrogenase family)
MEKVVLITGAAQGLGRALAEEFLSRGWRVIATDMDDLSMAGLLTHRQAWIFNMDVTSSESVRQVFEQISRTGTIIDLIINNAGIDRYFPVSEAPVDQFKQVFEVNVFGGYRVNQTFLPIIRKPGGRIIHISSEAFKLTLPFMPYPMSKQLVESYAKALRIELKFLGIDVVIVRPGAIRTILLDTVSNLNPNPQGSPMAGHFAKFATLASKQIGRTTTPEQAAVFIRKVASLQYPASVYRINNMLLLRMAVFLPFSLLERLIYKLLR